MPVRRSDNFQHQMTSNLARTHNGIFNQENHVQANFSQNGAIFCFELPKLILCGTLWKHPQMTLNFAQKMPSLYWHATILTVMAVNGSIRP